MKTGSDLTESSKEGNDSKRAGLPMMMTYDINQKMVFTHHSIIHVPTFTFSIFIKAFKQYLHELY
jgi:hypothetical protein